MLIPSIDLQQGRIVQLIQGERLAIATDDIDLWIHRFSTFPVVQLIDLDAAMGRGDNDALVRRIAAALPCRVGGGVRSIDRAQALVALDARVERTCDRPEGLGAQSCVQALLVGSCIRCIAHGWSDGRVPAC